MVNRPHKISDFLPFNKDPKYNGYKFECRKDEYHNGKLVGVHLHVFLHGKHVAKLWYVKDGRCVVS